MQRQTCKACGRPDKFDFCVPPSVWAAIVPRRYRQRVVCLYCFDEFAREAGVGYAKDLRVLYFAGDAAVFQFASERSVDLTTSGRRRRAS